MVGTASPDSVPGNEREYSAGDKRPQVRTQVQPRRRWLVECYREEYGLGAPLWHADESIGEQMRERTEREQREDPPAFGVFDKNRPDEDEEENDATGLEPAPVERDAEQRFDRLTRDQCGDVVQVGNERANHPDGDVRRAEPAVANREECGDSIGQQDVCEQVRHRTPPQIRGVRSGQIGSLGASVAAPARGPTSQR